MKNALIGILVLNVFSAVADVSVDRVLVRQQWPWSSQIRIDYEVSGATAAGVNLDVEIKAGALTLDTEAVNRAMLDGEIYGVKNGYGFIAVDPTLAFGSGFTGREITARITVAATPVPLKLDQIEYRVYDLVSGDVQELRRRDFYNHRAVYGDFTTDYTTIGPNFTTSCDDVFIWTGVNEKMEYKTTKLVMKRMHSAGVEWYMGPPTDAVISDGTYEQTRFKVKFSKDFYIGVFELTQGQNETITGTNSAYFAKTGANHPLETVNRKTVMTGADGFCMMARAKFPGHTFNFPSEAEWEYATKAGCDGATMPNGKEWTAANFGELEGYTSGRGNTSSEATDGVHYAVGTGRPNAYGLWNTLGNVQEMPRDQVRKNLLNYYTNTRGLTQPFVDPETSGNDVGADAAYPYKGMDFNEFNLDHAHPYYRFGRIPNTTKNSAGCPGVYGCRVMCPVE